MDSPLQLTPHAFSRVRSMVHGNLSVDMDLSLATWSSHIFCYSTESMMLCVLTRLLGPSDITDSSLYLTTSLLLQHLALFYPKFSNFRGAVIPGVEGLAQ